MNMDGIASLKIQNIVEEIWAAIVHCCSQGES